MTNSLFEQPSRILDRGKFYDVIILALHKMYSCSNQEERLDLLYIQSMNSAHYLIRPNETGRRLTTGAHIPPLHSSAAYSEWLNSMRLLRIGRR